MPSKSKKQAKLMAIAAHNKRFADQVGIDQKVAREWVEADKREAEKRKSKSKKRSSSTEDHSDPIYKRW